MAVRILDEDDIGSLVAQQGTNLVVVNVLADLPAPVANVITLDANKSYLIQGTIVLGINRIVLSTSNLIFGFDKSTDMLVYTGSAAMITGVNQDVSLKNLMLVANTSGATVFDIVGTITNNYEIKDCIFANCKKLGTISGFNVCILQKNYITLCDQGLTFGTVASDDLIIIDNYFQNNNNAVGCIFFNILAGGSYSDIVISRNHLGTLSNETGVNFGAITLAEYGKMLDNTFHITGVGVVGVDYSSSGWLFQGNSDVLNTVANGQVGFVDNVNTTSVGNVAVGITAIWNLKAGANKFIMPSNSILRYVDKEPASLRLVANLCAYGASNYTCEATIWKNGVQQNESKMGFTVYTAREFCTIQFFDNLAVMNDQYQVRLRKTTAGAVTTTVIDCTLSAFKL